MMLRESIVATQDLNLVSKAATPDQKIRVAVICDFREEAWPSMDLNGDLLYEFLAKNHAAQIATTQVRPHFRRRFMRIPLIGNALGWNADRLVNRHLDYARWLRARRSAFDLFHIVDHSYSQLAHVLPPERTVVTCHDLDTFRCLLEPESEKRPRWFRAMAQRTLDGFRRAAHVITNSHTTRGELLRYRLFPAEKITVIHSGVHPAFSEPADPAAEQEAARLLTPSSPGEILLLSVGSTIPRKRIDILLRVFAAVRQELPRIRLVRIGGPFTPAQLQLARELDVEGAISVLPFLERKVVASVYRRASLLLQTSESEGFGMPIAEAMACGCPVVASDLTVLREIGGNACSYCRVGDIDHWKSTVTRLLAEDAPPAARRQKALAQVAGYTWAENARRTTQVYWKVLGL